MVPFERGMTMVVGDVVRLKCGGPAMVVVGLIPQTEGEEAGISVCWHNANIMPQEHTYPYAEKLERHWSGIDLSEKAAELVIRRAEREIGGLFKLYHREDIPRRKDQGPIPHYRTQKHALFGQQEGYCNGCKVSFPFRNFTFDHIVPQSQGGTDHLDNLQLLCGACNSTKGDRDQRYLLAALKRQRISEAG